MQVLLQKNIFNEHEYDLFSENIKKQAITQEVNVIPFLHEFDGPVYVKPDYCFGSTRFVDVCRDKGYPVFKSFGPTEEIYAGHYLNDEGWDCKLGEIDFRGHPKVFVKPYKEKFFTGVVIDQETLFDKVQLCFSEDEDPNEEIVRVSPESRIFSESRFFILDGKVIAGSIYKAYGQAERIKLTENDFYWKHAQNLVNDCGSPDDGFVMDLALIDHDVLDVSPHMGMKIVELNNFNSSGFYKCDISSIIGHLSSRKKLTLTDDCDIFYEQ